MKNYTITVNGNVYDVTVEENGAGASPAPAARPAAAPKAAPKAAPAAKTAAGAGSIKVAAGAAGKYSRSKQASDRNLQKVIPL